MATRRKVCAHNNCILNDLSTDGDARTTSRVVIQALGEIVGIGKSQRRLKMRNERLRQIAAVLYAHRELAPDGVKEHAAVSLVAFTARAVLEDHGGDVAALKEAEPWLFGKHAAAGVSGKTGLPNAGAAADADAQVKRWEKLAGLE